jgi:hypothetical protein
MAALQGLGRDRRRLGRQSAVTGLYSPEAPRSRRTSRDTTEGSRPIERAIYPIPRRAFNPVAISTRSENDEPCRYPTNAPHAALANRGCRFDRMKPPPPGAQFSPVATRSIFSRR